jgi:hypothetical protein
MRCYKYCAKRILMSELICNLNNACRRRIADRQYEMVDADVT